MASMDNEIRQAPPSPVSNKDFNASEKKNSPNDSPASSRQNLSVKIGAVTTEAEISPQLTPRQWRTSQLQMNRNSRYTIYEDPEADDGMDWRPGFKQQFPWIGFTGLMTLIFATSMAVAILAISNRKRVKDWPFERFPTQPNVLLNIANQVQNLGLITMIGQGLAVAWWRKALRGSKLKTLHRDHSYSYSFFAIITSGKHFNIIALAALMTKFAVIDSTLFQKATKTIITQEKEYTNATVTGWVETNWPQNSGGIPGDEGRIKTVDTAWVNVIDAYQGKVANGKMHDSLEDKASFFGCPFRQECFGRMRALGFGFECSTFQDTVDYGLQQQSQIGGASTSYPLWDVQFSTTWANDTRAYASVQLDMLYVNSRAGENGGVCPGDLYRRSCKIRPAIVEYPVTVMVPSEEELKGKNIVTHIKFFDNANQTWPLGTSLDGINQIDRLKVIEYVDLNEKLGDISTVGALQYVMSNLYGANANLTHEKDWDVSARGSSAQTTFFAENDQDNHSRCWYNIAKKTKDDPVVELLRKVNTLAFTTALYFKGQPTTDVKLRKDAGMASATMVTSVTGIVEQYVTNFGYVGGALAATFVTVMLVLPVYWGFWQLGRKVTLGPLEISHAFGAPVIAPDRTKAHHAEFDEVLEDVGHRRVRYGQLRDAPPGHMEIAEPDMVAEPNSSKRWRAKNHRTNKRVGIGAMLGGIIGLGAGGHAMAS